MLDAMLPYMVSYYGNPHSRTHSYGWESEAAVEVARKVGVSCDQFFILRPTVMCNVSICSVEHV